MSQGRRTRTEHAGAKNGGGFWGTRAEAKGVSRRLRRQRARVEIRRELREEGR
ncbi:MAG TPA: hypothetical protein VK204_15350 [Nocardioidaceae bacterium]|nr:hypothetical protein [Nocardioidaceae bacterium]